jgi:hypothetical protein
VWKSPSARAIGAQRLVKIGMHQCQQRLHFGWRHMLKLCAEPAAVDLPAIVTGGCPQFIHQRAPLACGEAGRKLWLMCCQRRVHGVEKAFDFACQDNGRLCLVGEKLLAKGDHAAQIGGSHHRQPLAHQGIVGVVPFGALGVHPNATFRNQIANFGQHQQKQLLGQRDMQNLTIAVNHESAICPQRTHAFPHRSFAFPIEVDGGYYQSASSALYSRMR